MKNSIIPLFVLLLCRLVSSQVDPTQDYYVAVAGDYNLYLPANLDYIVVTACGAYGGGPSGGSGGCITTKLSSPDVSSGAFLRFSVGGVGGSCSLTTTCYAPGGSNGGGSGTGNYYYAGYGYGGGGMTTLYNGNSNTLLLVAGGGGGQGSGGPGGAGGVAGASGQCGWTVNQDRPPALGGCTAGSYTGSCSLNYYFYGAGNWVAAGAGGGGGAGYYGGAAGYYCGGGGGSNYARGIQNSFSNPSTTKSGSLKIHFSVHPAPTLQPTFTPQPTLQPVSAAPSASPTTIAPTRLPPGSSPYYFFTMINVS
jgi:hypothetical protein